MENEFLNNSNKLDRSLSLTDLSKLSIASPSNFNVFDSPVRRFDDVHKHFGNRPLVRHFSCEQIYDPRISSSPLIKIKDTVSVGLQQGVAWSIRQESNKFKNLLIQQGNMSDTPNDSGDPPDIKHFGNLPNFNFSFVKDCVEKLDVTPMDIDKSTEEPKDDVSECDTKIRKRRRIKKEDDVQENRRKILKGLEDEKSSSNKISKARLFFFLVFVPMCSYLTLFHHTQLSINENLKVLSQKVFGQRDRCDEVLNINPMLNDLKEHLYGQDSVIENLSKNFHVNIFKTLIFTGPTGVGKTYTVKRIEETFAWSKNVHTVTYPVSESGIQVLKLTLSHCGYNLIVMDGLTNTSSEHIYDFVRSIQQHSYENKLKSFIILVYNSQDISDDLKYLPYDNSQDILKGFKNEFKDTLDVSLIVFNKLSIDDVVRCTMSEAEILGMKISEKQALEIAKDIPEIYGCKGVRARLNIQNPIEY